jgi:RecA-family ATPase
MSTFGREYDYAFEQQRRRRGEAWSELKSKANGHDTSGGEPAAFTTTCAFDLENRLVPDRQWLVEGAIPHENVTLLSGDGGLGKTILALMLGMSAATKTDWLGFPTMQGPFLYIGAEDDDDEIHRRLDQIRVEMGTKWDELADFHFKSLVGEDAIMATFDRTNQTMRATQVLLGLEQRIKDLGAVACVIDTSADVFGGDEINRTQVRQFISLLRAICRRQHVTIVLLSHPSVAGMASGSGISGSTAWNNSVRSRLYLEADGDARILRFMKSNYGPKGKPLSLVYERGLFVHDVAKSGKTPAEADAMFLLMLDKYEEQGRPVCTNYAANYAPKVFASDKGCGFKKEALKDAMDRLLERKEIRAEESGPASRRRTRLVRVT